jgi:hypothetical protein
MRVKQIVEGQSDSLEHAVERREFQAAFAVQEVRDVRLSETGAAGELHAGQFASVDALAEGAAQGFLKGDEAHGRQSITRS